jgi:hypothetical protein
MKAQEPKFVEAIRLTNQTRKNENLLAVDISRLTIKLAALEKLVYQLINRMEALDR